MDYKKIIKSRDLRIKILELLNFIPDKMMLKIQYRIKMGRRLNLKNPTRYTEQLQWYKLYHRDPLMAQCADKYEVRSYVESKGLGHILNKCYGVFNAPDEIDFDKLPNQFVLKDTLGGGGNSVLICTDKTTFDIDDAIQKMWGWVNSSTGKNSGREWVYEGRAHRIIIEEYLEGNKDYGLIDYKFFVFNQAIEFLYVVSNRRMGRDADLIIMDAEFNQLPVVRPDELPPERLTPKPVNFDLMKEIVQILVNDFLHARIDLYCVDGLIRFGEITFFPGSGYMKFEPDGFDEEIGEKFEVKYNKHINHKVHTRG